MKKKLIEVENLDLKDKLTKVENSARYNDFQAATDDEFRAVQRERDQLSEDVQHLKRALSEKEQTTNSLRQSLADEKTVAQLSVQTSEVLKAQQEADLARERMEADIARERLEADIARERLEADINRIESHQEVMKDRRESIESQMISWEVNQGNAEASVPLRRESRIRTALYSVDLTGEDDDDDMAYDHQPITEDQVTVTFEADLTDDADEEPSLATVKNLMDFNRRSSAAARLGAAGLLD